MNNGKLHIEASGLLYRVTLWETPILATVSELFFRITGKHPDRSIWRRLLLEKAVKMKEHSITFSLFGMRRRFSFDVEDRVTELLKKHAGEILWN